MDAERYRQIKAILLDALELPEPDRQAFVARACGADQPLRHEVEALLEHGDEDDGVLAPIGPLAMRHMPAPADEEATTADAFVGREIGNYRVLRRLGEGGMGVVYLAQDTRLGRHAALKFLRSDLAFDRQALVRFMREARAGAAFDHPNICTLYGVEQTPAGEIFLAMAYCRGETLKTHLAGGPLAAAMAFAVTRQVGAGLAAAHDAGVIHRDVKPANIMLMDGVAKLLDFGIAKFVDQTSVTVKGATIGTPAYASPEQSLGGSVDHRTDIYALGVVLYEMLAGRRPFDRAPIGVGRRWRPIHECNPDVSPHLNAVIARALEPDPAERWQSMREFLAAVDNTGSERPAPSPLSVATGPTAPDADITDAEGLAVAGHLHEAAATARAAAAAPGADVDTIVRAGRICHFANDWLGALLLQRLATERTADSALAWLDLAVTCAASGDSSEAPNMASRALALPAGLVLVVAALGNSGRATGNRSRFAAARRRLDELGTAGVHTDSARELLDLQFGDTGRPLEYLYGGSSDAGLGRFAGLMHVPGSLTSIVRSVGLIAYLGLEPSHDALLHSPALMALIAELDA